MTIPADPPAVSVIVPARNAAQTLPALLDGLALQQLNRRHEVIVVADLTSDDRTVEVAECHPTRPHVVHRRGLGPGAARNLGAAAAHGPVLAFTDADCIPASDWLAEGLLALGQFDIVQGAVLPPPGLRVDPFDRRLIVTSEYGLYETANLFIRHSLFDELEGFQDLFLAGDRPFGEDTWFVWQARRQNARVGFAAGAVVHHAVFPGSRTAFVRERMRVRHFPKLVRLIPELRGMFLYRRLFLSYRTARFDAALLSALLAGRLRSPLPLTLALPYARSLLDDIRTEHRAGSLELVLTLVASDAVTCGALAVGSVAARRPVL